MRSSPAVSFRALSVLAVALVAVALVAEISPAATKFLTKKRALKLFYTRAQADAAFVNVGEMATSAGTADTANNANLLDNIDSTQLVQNQGSIKLAANRPWKVFPGSGITISDNFFGFTMFQIRWGGGRPGTASHPRRPRDPVRQEPPAHRDGDLLRLTRPSSRAGPGRALAIPPRIRQTSSTSQR